MRMAKAIAASRKGSFGFEAPLPAGEGLGRGPEGEAHSDAWPHEALPLLIPRSGIFSQDAQGDAETRQP